MPNYLLEVRSFNKVPYIKVFLRDEKNLEKVSSLLQTLASVRRANVTRNSKPDLTVYFSRTYSVDEAIEEICSFLDAFFESKPLDPIFKQDDIDTISDTGYRQIINAIYDFGINLEKLRRLSEKFDEALFRDYFLPHLNLKSSSHTATGETFNGRGKTDILVQNSKGENVFIAECKIWRGEEELRNGISQLLERYVTWRDEKVAMMIFNQSVKGFSDILEKAVRAVEQHGNFLKSLGKSRDTSYSFLFKHPDDYKRTIMLELIMFNCT